ncbi:MAG: hypothetical protein KME56_06180 [Candidatus Thiodiazotropha sp. (ex Ctena orbiculata)]|nr:hypothetical protein [Candidatus Thiodiazotropha taylori]MBT2996198.1 hypothetical protein [Candidatus Thiodiazotropha taylori]MBT2999657.1 hypothetical protein [Candidatus Thiodiazotropha taylori]MBV2106301.1 hypothetical protein [Candidatus Thiodiazotropha taylori]MBV2110433.1 hypothetical protein [Candidatus Thiodiazotropha taylori]
MKTIKDPVQFSSHYGIDKLALEEIGALDPILNVDTRLFIDPMLLESSRHPEMQAASKVLIGFFEMIIKLLIQSRQEGDIAWRAAYQRFLFTEISGTCIGYGSGIHGSGWGPVKAKNVTNTAKQIIDIGIRDADLFMAIPLLEDNIGPDLVSDMVTNIIISELLDFNERIVSALEVNTSKFRFGGRSVELPVNPTESKEAPVILLPFDVLRELPLANDWEEVCTVASENEVLRKQVNELIGEIWRTKSKQKKTAIREKALSSAEAFMALLNTIRGADPQPYDLKADPDGHFEWLAVRDGISIDYPLVIELPDESSASLMGFVMKIIEQYTWLIEKRGLSRLLWKEANVKRVHESVAQMLFYAVAESYARANDIDITPEADIGRGAVDFKFSSGYNAKVLVEVKFSDHGYVVSGYENQLEIYKNAERTENGVYVVIDVGHMGNKDEEIIELKNKSIQENGVASEFVVIDGEVKPSASKVH